MQIRIFNDSISLDDIKGAQKVTNIIKYNTQICV